MLQRLWMDTVWAKGIMAVCASGIMIRLITVFSYRGMRRAAENAARTKKKWVLALKKRYENYERFDRITNVEIFVDRFFERKGIFGIPLRVWDKACLQLSIFSAILGTAGAFYSHGMGFGTDRTFATLCSGFLAGGILLLLHNLGGTEELKNQVVTALKDYLANGTARRADREAAREKGGFERQGEKLPTREEVEGLSEAAVTEEERQVLIEVLEEYFW